MHYYQNYIQKVNKLAKKIENNIIIEWQLSTILRLISVFIIFLKILIKK